MRYVLAIVLLIALCATAGYYGLPMLFRQETAGLRSEIQDIKGRLLKIESFIRSEEDMRNAAKLRPDAELYRVINKVNAISSKTASLEEISKKTITTIDDKIEQQKTITEEKIKEQRKTIENIQKETEINSDKIMVNSVIANIREHILKTKVELVSKNYGNVKNELDEISGLYEKLKTIATGENKKLVENLQETLIKIKIEIDADLPASINRIDLLWHETGKLFRGD